MLAENIPTRHMHAFNIIYLNTMELSITIVTCWWPRQSDQVHGLFTEYAKTRLECHTIQHNCGPLSKLKRDEKATI